MGNKQDYIDHELEDLKKRARLQKQKEANEKEKTRLRKELGEEPILEKVSSFLENLFDGGK